MSTTFDLFTASLGEHVVDHFHFTSLESVMNFLLKDIKNYLDDDKYEEDEEKMQDMTLRELFIYDSNMYMDGDLYRAYLVINNPYDVYCCGNI